MKSFYFIRHGESEANAAGFPAGQMDSPLTARGESQAKALDDVLSSLEPSVDYILTSTLSRAWRTAEILNAKHGLPVFKDRKLCEQHFGDLQGKSMEGIRDSIAGDWYIEPKNGETFQKFGERVHDVFNAYFQKPDPDIALIVSHGGVAHAFGVRYDLNLNHLDNCTLYFFEAAENKESSADGKWRIYQFDQQDGVLKRELVDYGI